MAQLADMLIVSSFDVGRLVQQFYRNLANRRMAATMLALCLLVDHDGQLPQTLSELVPTYLPHVPEDPIDGTWIKYSPNRNPPAVYSAGSSVYFELKLPPPSPKAQNQNGQPNIQNGQNPQDQ